MQIPGPAKDLVLVGGGHAHVHVLKSVRMRLDAGTRVTLISRDARTPYSGMLPGLIAGHYTPDEAHLDLYRIAVACGVRFIQAEAIGLDPIGRQVHLRGRPSVRYDVVSLDTGSTPEAEAVPGAAEHALPVKPVAAFLAAWTALVEEARATRRMPKIVIVGGGAGGVETAISMAERLRAALPGVPPDLTLLTRGRLLARMNERGRRHLARALADNGIEVVQGADVTWVGADRVLCADGRVFPCDRAVWVTWAGAPRWLAETGLALNARGFVAVEPTLQSTSHPDVFAAGDVASVLAYPREKAGVYAVRQGPPLARNLFLALQGRQPRPFRPQATALALVGIGGGEAVAVRGAFAAKGRLVWRVKERIDRRWMRGYQELRPAPMPSPSSAADPMRCGGCGAKVPAAVLRRALHRLGLEGSDDAAVVAMPGAGVLLQTIDGFRPFVSDPWLFGRIAARHAIGDILAMNGRPETVLALVNLPPMAPALLEDDLVQMLAGAQTVFAETGTRLVGGHSAESAEVSLGFAVTGVGDEGTLLRKAGLRAGDRLVITKPVGTGTILAGAMRGEAQAASIEAALSAMGASPGNAVATLVAHGARACTDVTGFGLAGHLSEMLRASGCGARLDASAIPTLPGALALMEAGIVSTLHGANAYVAIESGGLGDARVQILFDPQTAGGFLAGLPPERAEPCLVALRAAGHSAALIGTVEEVPGLRVTGL
ncbi:MAG TPA: selenide, water dikinase SelD [Microvirga sp.]|jgi:selenide,water dikinase